MEVCFLASGERVATLDAADFEGKTCKAVKQALTAEIGVTRFRQRLFWKMVTVRSQMMRFLPPCQKRFSWWSWNFARPMQKKRRR